MESDTDLDISKGKDEKFFSDTPNVVNAVPTTRGAAKGSICPAPVSKPLFVFGAKPAPNASAEKNSFEAALDAALQCRDRGLLEAVFPLFVATAPGSRGPYFGGGCAPKPADVSVASVEAELISQLDRAGLGTPYVDNVTARTVFSRITGFQAAFLENDVIASLKAACENVVKAVKSTSSASYLPVASSSSPISAHAHVPVTGIEFVAVDGTVTFISSTGK